MDLSEEFSDTVDLLHSLKEQAVFCEKYLNSLSERARDSIEITQYAHHFNTMLSDTVKYIFAPSEDKVMAWLFAPHSQHYYLSATEFLYVLDDDWQNQ